MKSAAVALALASSATALVGRDSPCCFGLSANGGPGGVVGQLSDGQNRIGQGLPGAQYCLSNGGITDGSGRGCILTPPTTQFQCDTGASPTGGFAVDSNGDVTYNGSETFQACPTGDNGGYNIYTTAPQGQQGCVPVTLAADNCKPAPPPPAPTTSSAPAPTTTSAPAPAKTCPASLSGPFEFPHLIVPVDSSAPDTAKGTSYNGEVSPTVSSIFDFDIPSSDQGKTCSLIFLLGDVSTSSYQLSGPGAIDFSMLSAPADQGTTANNAPSVKTDYGVTTVAANGAYNIATFDCPAGQRVAYELKSASGTSLSYFQDYNAPGIGLYITTC